MLIGIFFITLSIIFFSVYLKSGPASTGAPEPSKKTTARKVLVKKSKSASKPTQPKYERVSIYYATESGTAETFANLLTEDAQKLGIRTRIIDVKDATIEMFKKDKLAIFLISTHFEGEPPTNADNFNNWFVKPSKTEAPIDLPALKYIVYGLGDTTYTYFGQFAKNVDKCLEKKNSIRVKDLAIGSNHTNNIFDHFLEWKENFWTSILDHVPLRAEGELVSEDEDGDEKENGSLPGYKFIAEFLEPAQVTNEKIGDWNDYEIGARKLLGALDGKIVEMRDLRQKNTDTGRTLHIELELPQGVSYETASNLVLYPENSEEAVRTVCDKILGLDVAQKFSLSTNKRFAKNRNIKKPFPSPITVGDYLRKYIDLQGVLKKTTLKALAELLTKEAHPNAKKYLEDLILPKNRLKYNALIKNKYGILDLLLEQNITLKLEELIDIGSQIQPRYYTIASSSLVNPSRVAICLSMTIDTLPSSKIRPGLVSGMLLDIFAQFKRQKNYQKTLAISFQKSNFTRPPTPCTSCICISTGAGFAPFKAFISEKKHLSSSAPSKLSSFGKLYIFFGCRNRDEDYIYKDEMFDANSNGTITALHEAFSREEERKYYVQDILMFKGALINDVLFKEDGVLYLCGNTGMAKNVKEVVVKAICEYQGLGVGEAEEEYLNLLDRKRICVEAWG